MLFALALYAVALCGICWYYRPKHEYSDFIVGNKSSGWLITTFGLFTLIGGGELVAGSSFGYVFGWYGLALFVGYGISFAILGFAAPAIVARSDRATVTYVDFATKEYGRTVGTTVLFSHLIAFFALLVLQLSAGGNVIASLTDLSYMQSVVACAIVIVVYLSTGGFRAVMVTDVVQGVVMLLLIALLSYIAVNLTGEGQKSGAGYALPSFDDSWGIVISGIFIGLASADVWQRMFAAKSESEARRGFVLGGIVLLIYGGLIVYGGILAKAAGLTDNPDEAFFSLLGANMPPILLDIAIFATVAAILSTADTEIFLLSSLVERAKGTIRGAQANEAHTVGASRGFIIVVVVLAVVTSYWGDDLALMFNWMFVGYMIVAPTIAMALFVKTNKAIVITSFVVTALMFVVLLILNTLTLANSYLLSIPAVLLFLASHMRSKMAGN